VPSFQLPNIKIQPSLDEGTKLTNKTSQVVKVDNSDGHEEFYHIYHKTLQKQQNPNKHNLSTHKQNNKDNNDNNIDIASNKITNKNKIELNDHINKNNNKNISKDEIKKFNNKNNKQKDISDILTQLINLSVLNKETHNKITKTNNNKQKIEIKKKINLTFLTTLNNNKIPQKQEDYLKIAKLTKKITKINKNSKLLLIDKKKDNVTSDKEIIDNNRKIHMKNKIIISNKYSKKKGLINNITVLNNIIKQKNLNNNDNKKLNRRNTKYLNIFKNINKQTIGRIEQTTKYKKNVQTQKSIEISKNKNKELLTKQLTEKNTKNLEKRDIGTNIFKKINNKIKNHVNKTKQVNYINNNNEINKLKSKFNLTIENENNNYKDSLKVKLLTNQKHATKQSVIDNINTNNKIIDTSSINYINQNILQKTQNTHINNKNIIQQINNFILDNFQNKNIGFNQKIAILQLHPPELGKIKVKLQLTNNIVNATFIADHPDIKQVLETNIQLLRQQLAQGGLQLNNCFINLNMNSRQSFSDLYRHSSKQNNATNFDILDEDKNLTTETITQKLNTKYNLFNNRLHLII